MEVAGAVLSLFYPVAFVYLLFALKRVYQQRWLITTLKALPLFFFEWLLFVAVNMAGFFIGFATM